MIGSARLISLSALLAASAMLAAQTSSSPQQSQTQQPDTAPQPYYDGKPQPAPLSQPPVSRPGTITIPAGTKVPLRLESAISTKSAQPGDGIYLRTIFPVAIDNTMAIPVGTYVQGVITEVKRPGRVKGRAEVLFRFTTLVYPDGYTVTIPGALKSVPGAENSKVKDKEGTVQADGTKGRDAGTIAETSAGGAAIGGLSGGGWKGAGIGGGIGAAAGTALVLLTRGNDVRLEAGSNVEMVLQRDLVLDDVNSHTRYYSGPPMGSSSEIHRFTVPPREGAPREGEKRAPVRPVLEPAPER